LNGSTWFDGLASIFARSGELSGLRYWAGIAGGLPFGRERGELTGSYSSVTTYSPAGAPS
jgi:hypothetical protein